MGQIVHRGAGAQANQTKKYISGIFSRGLQQGIAESNPAVGMKVPVRLTPRDRYLSEREIDVRWQTLDQGPLPGHPWRFAPRTLPGRPLRAR